MIKFVEKRKKKKKKMKRKTTAAFSTSTRVYLVGLSIIDDLETNKHYYNGDEDGSRDFFLLLPCSGEYIQRTRMFFLPPSISWDWKEGLFTHVDFMIFRSFSFGKGFKRLVESITNSRLDRGFVLIKKKKKKEEEVKKKKKRKKEWRAMA